MWKAYEGLAWTEAWFEDRAAIAEEVETYRRRLERHAAHPVHELLHLGCGAGAHDRAFKRHYAVTGVDLSPAMLALARQANPEVEYHEGDMRSLRLGRQFDAVVIPDSSDYLATRDDLSRAFATAAYHLRPGGVLLVVAKPRELYRDNNFAYTGERDGTHITLLENNHALPEAQESYEAALVYLIRRQGACYIHTDVHRLGLFPQAVWEGAFRDQGLTLHHYPLEGLYDAYLLGDGAYPQRLFIGVKPPV